MKTLNNRLTPKQKEFFDNLSIYIDKPIYFYGSILRNDYIRGNSDIDIDIFSDNETSTIELLCNFLNIKKSTFKKSFYKIGSSIAYGYKCGYTDEINGIIVEISIYNNKYKSLVLSDHGLGLKLPFYITYLLIIIKWLYYKLNILPVNVYRRCKQFLMNKNGEQKFIILD